LSDQNKVVKFKKRKSINIGVVVFLILFLYIAINVYLYFTKEQLTIYEVTEGSTKVNNRITALILREEQLVYADTAGYILYYQKDGARVAKNASVYSVSENMINNVYNSETAIVLTDNNEAEIKHEVRNFQNSYSDDDFSKVYEFKENANSSVLDILNSTLVSADENSAITGTIKSEDSGIITYYMDDFEDVTPDQVSSNMFQKDQYTKTNLRTTDKLSKKAPVYKIITSEKWNLVLPLSKEQYDKLVDKKVITFTVLEDNMKMTANLELSAKGSDYYAILTMSKKMIDYLGERYLDIEINFDYVDGLKIPVSSIVERDFYEVPENYFTLGGESTKIGVIRELYGENGEITYPFVPTDIYDTNDSYRYIDAQLFQAGTVIKSPTDSSEYTLSKTIKIAGVYNVNQGYAVFKRVEVLSQDKEYCIIKDNTSNGLSAYDHIVLNGELAIEQKIIY